MKNRKFWKILLGGFSRCWPHLTGNEESYWHGGRQRAASPRPNPRVGRRPSPLDRCRRCRRPARAIRFLLASPLSKSLRDGDVVVPPSPSSPSCVGVRRCLPLSPWSYAGTRESRERDGALAQCCPGPSSRPRRGSSSSSSWVVIVLVVTACHRRPIGLR